MKNNVKNSNIIMLFKTVIIILLATLVAFFLDYLKLRGENILMLYAIAVMVIITQAKKLLWGAISAIVCVLAFNYFFTAPRYTFQVNDPNYFVSFGIFLVLAFIVSTLTTRLNHQVIISRQNEERTSELYKISNGYLNVIGRTSIISYGEKSLSNLIKKNCKLYIKTSANQFTDKAVSWCYENSAPCGFGESIFNDTKYKYLPIKSGQKTLGVVSIEVGSIDLTKDETLYINTMLGQITITLEHDFLTKAEETNRINIEKEKLKSNLLRSISHDLRTPLTSIAGNAEFLLQSIDKPNLDISKSMLTDISTDASWLSNLVENLLNMTRIEDGRLLLNTQKEVVDDIISEAVGHVSKRLANHTLVVNKPDDIVLVPMDGSLIIQVLVNLIDNSIKHTRSDSEIVVSAYINEGMVFEVSDNGGGIAPDFIDSIFDSFVTSSATVSDTHRGVGLGLSIVKSIVGAHGGEITAQNNDKGGATFKFELPLEVSA